MQSGNRNKATHAEKQKRIISFCHNPNFQSTILLQNEFQNNIIPRTDVRFLLLTEELFLQKIRRRSQPFYQRQVGEGLLHASAVPPNCRK